MNYAELKGSEKQIAWAEAIREKFAAIEYCPEVLESRDDQPLISNFHEKFRVRYIEESRKQFNENVLKAIENMLKTETSAKKYIDNRYLVESKYLVDDFPFNNVRRKLLEMLVPYIVK